MVKVFMLLYADDIVIFGKSANELQEGLNVLSEYCQKWKLTVNAAKTKAMVFRKGGVLPRNLGFYYEGNRIQIVKVSNILELYLQ